MSLEEFQKSLSKLNRLITNSTDHINFIKPEQCLDKRTEKKIEKIRKKIKKTLDNDSDAYKKIYNATIHVSDLISSLDQPIELYNNNDLYSDEYFPNEYTHIEETIEINKPKICNYDIRMSTDLDQIMLAVNCVYRGDILPGSRKYNKDRERSKTKLKNNQKYKL